MKQIYRGLPEIDRLMAEYLVGSVANKDAKISRWLSNNSLQQVKRGFYVVGPDFCSRPVSREILANKLHQPSYISLAYALSFYGLIPEAVSVLGSVTTTRQRIYDTSFGSFTYRVLPEFRYAFGFRRHALPDGSGFLIATAEKALLDVLYFHGQIRSKRDLESLLFDNLRIDPEELQRLDKAGLRAGARQFKTRSFDRILVPWLEVNA